MPIFFWDDRYSIGYTKIDTHHKRLTELLNKVYDYFVWEFPLTKVEHALEELAEYAAYHFACEEQWIAQTPYQQSDLHKKEQGEFYIRLNEIEKTLSKMGMVSSLAPLLDLINCFMQHIAVTDHSYHRHLAAKSRDESI